MGSHIILDMLNKQGVQLLWPIKGNLRWPLSGIKTGGTEEKIILLFLIILNIALVINYWR